MNEKQALKLATLVMLGKHPTIKDLAPEASRYKLLNARDDACVRAHGQYQQLVEAMDMLERMMSQGRLF